MSLKDAYRKKMEAEIAEMQARLQLLKARADVAIAEGKIMAREELADVETKLDAATIKLRELARASEGAFHEMKAGMETAWDALKSASRKAAKKYK